jgi:hypothetical protein
VVEPQGATVCKEYAISWRRQEFNLAELAKLRWVDNWTMDQLTRHFGIGSTAIKERLQKIATRNAIM